VKENRERERGESDKKGERELKKMERKRKKGDDINLD